MEGRQTKVSSFNCAGFKGNYEYINETVYANCDILLLQETWLHKFEFNMFNAKIKNCQYHAVSAMDESDIGRVGRPKGGCAIIWHKKSGTINTTYRHKNTKVMCSGGEIEENKFSYM